MNGWKVSRLLAAVILVALLSGCNSTTALYRRMWTPVSPPPPLSDPDHPRNVWWR